MDPSIQLHRYQNKPLGPGMGLFYNQVHLVSGFAYSFSYSKSLSLSQKGGDNNMLERDILGLPTLPKEQSALEFQVTRTGAFLRREMWPIDGMRRRKELRRRTSSTNSDRSSVLEDISDLLGSIAEGIADAASSAGNAIGDSFDGDGGGGFGGGDGGGGGGGGD